MVGRRPSHQEAQNLAIHTDFRRRSKGKGIASDHGTQHTTPRPARPRSTSMTSTCDGDDAEDEEDQIHTHLSASSAGNTDISSASAMSAQSTAQTSNMADDDDDDTRSHLSPHAHPTLTVLELVTNTASASALPNSFDFNVSRKGNFVAVYSASNIWLIKTVQLPRLWARTLQVKRKPVAVDVTEDGFLLAVLSKPTQVDVYEIHNQGQDRPIKKRRTLLLAHEAKTVAISPDGLILIAGNTIGIEVLEIGPDAPETSRRTLSGPVGDILEFSDCGRTLLITSHARKSASSSLYVLPGLYDGPFDDEGVPIQQAPATVWTGSVLFPETAKIARQATLIPDTETGQVNELFAFNAQEDTWGVYDIGNQRFTQRKMFLPDQQRWTRSEFLDDAMPAVSPNADLAAVALRMRGTTSIWIYQVPAWDYRTNSKSDQSPIQPCFCIPIVNDGSDSVQELCTLRWVAVDAQVQRLVAVGNSSNATMEEVPGAPAGSKGVVLVLDFDKSKPTNSPIPTPTKIVYDLDPLCPGDLLPEGSIDFEREVELVRRRTMAQSRALPDTRGHARADSTPSHSGTRISRRREPQPQPPIVSVGASGADEEELTAEEVQAAFEVPYDMQQPRSQVSLLRAATVAAVSPANRRHLRALPFRPLDYRRADGLRELPHESDADNWVPPPPAYTTTAEASHSVSLSHPNGAPVPAGNAASTPSSRRPSIPPVPAIPANIPLPPIPASHPYQTRVGSRQSQSSTDLSRPPSQIQVASHRNSRRPSLVHPLTFPSPDQTVSSRRRRSSAATSRPPSQAHTQPLPPVPHLPNQSAYHATAAIHTAMAPSSRPSTRPNLRSRRAIESTFDLRPPPIVDPSTGRRGSAPETHRSRLPPPPPLSGSRANRASMPVSPARPRARERRTLLLPRLTTMGDALGRVVSPQAHDAGSISAPPRTDSRILGEYRDEGYFRGGGRSASRMEGGGRSASRLEGWLSGGGSGAKDVSPKKRTGCAVM
ncbi:unnamed protein product [Periconia digitata]|uniref:DUF7165 domain-containing protein n=1 Tax=Periconia digitata TaxID=1303443 RepID=A0A9W4XNF2_9PLEO|nr:unnamed protein product [Periconia digitata]